MPTSKAFQLKDHNRDSVYHVERLRGLDLRTHGTVLARSERRRSQNAHEALLLIRFGLLSADSLLRILLKRNESRGVGGSDAGASVAYGFVGHREFSEVVSNHFGFDFDPVEQLSVVDGDDRSDHFGHDEHVAKVSFDGFRLVHGSAGFLRFAETSDESLRFRFESAINSSTSARVDQFGELFVVHVQELVELDTSEHELLEGALLAQRRGAFHLSLVHRGLLANLFYLPFFHSNNPRR